jgi:hypothetical protein
MGEDLNTPVSGPSAFWVLAALALNCMLQPCGKVCGFHPRLRTYLRSSPFVAISDTVAIIIRFGVYLFHGLSPTQAAHAICTVRFKDQNVSDPDGIQALEEQVWVRSLAFLLGLVLQTIKIFACGGLPLTRAAAVAYLGSFFKSSTSSVAGQIMKTTTLAPASLPQRKRRGFYMKLTTD